MIGVTGLDIPTGPLARGQLDHCLGQLKLPSTGPNGPVDIPLFAGPKYSYYLPFTITCYELNLYINIVMKNSAFCSAEMHQNSPNCL